MIVTHPWFCRWSDFLLSLWVNSLLVKIFYVLLVPEQQLPASSPSRGVQSELFVHSRKQKYHEVVTAAASRLSSRTCSRSTRRATHLRRSVRMDRWCVGVIPGEVVTAARSKISCRIFDPRRKRKKDQEFPVLAERIPRVV